MLAVLSVSLLVVATTRSSEDIQACDPITGTFSHRDRESIFHIYSCGVDASRPVGVLVHLHGDGAGEFVGPEDPEGTLHSLARVARDRNMLLVAPQTPDQGNGWTWWRNLGENVAWLSAFMQDDVLSRRNVDAENVWWSGYAGGADMLSRGVLTHLSPLVTSGAVMMAGGAAPVTLEAPRHPYPRDKSDTLPLSWVVGAHDDNVADARDGSQWYQDRGFGNVSLAVSEDTAQANLPQADVLEIALDAAQEG